MKIPRRLISLLPQYCPSRDTEVEEKLKMEKIARLVECSEQRVLSVSVYLSLGKGWFSLFYSK